MKKNFFEKPFIFMKKEYTNGQDLVKAMLENWEIAISVLRRGDVPGFEEHSEKMWRRVNGKAIDRDFPGEVFENIHLALMLCTLDPSLGGIPYMDYESKTVKIASLYDVGEAILKMDMTEYSLDGIYVSYAVTHQLFSKVNPKLEKIESLVYGVMAACNEIWESEEVKETGKEEQEALKEEMKEQVQLLYSEFAAALQGKTYFKYNGIGYFSEEEFIAGVIEPAMRSGISRTISLFYQLFEAETYQNHFQRWYEGRDEEHGNDTYKGLYKSWCEFKEYAEKKYRVSWYKRSYKKVPECQTPDDFFVQNNVGLKQESVIDELEEAVQDTAGWLEKLESCGEDIQHVTVLLEAIRKAVLDRVNQCDNSFEQKEYTCWKEIKHAESVREERMLQMQDVAVRMKSIYEGYMADCLLDNWDSREIWEKEYIGCLLMFPMAEGISTHAQEVADMVNRLQDVHMMNKLTHKIISWLKKDDFFADKDSLRDFYFDLGDSLTAGMWNSKDNMLEEVWNDLCQLYNQIYVDEDSYRRLFQEFKAESEWCSQVHSTSYLDSPKYYGRIEAAPKVEFFKGKNYEKGVAYKTYTQNVEGYNALINEFNESMQRYVRLLEGRLSGVLENTPIGELVKTRTNRMEEFAEVEDKGREELKRYVDMINAEYTKRFGNISSLIKAEKKKIERDKKKKERRKALKKHRFAIITTLVVVVILAASGAAFYNKYMTPVYYGTQEYYGTGRGYVEYTIHESATIIAPFVFQGANINSIEIPEGVERIEEGAFADCTQLESIVIPASVNYIGEGAFLGCTSLKEVEFLGVVSEVYEYAFADCINLQTVKTPKDMCFVYTNIFENCHSLDADKAFAKQDNANGYIGDLRYNLYTKITEDSVLIENNTQLMNFLIGKEVYENVSGIYENLSYLEGDFSKVRIIEAGKEGETAARFSFDYVEGIKSFSVEGTMEGTAGEEIIWDLECTRAELLLDDILVQDEEGRYTGLADLLVESQVVEPAYDLDIIMHEDEIVVNEITAMESTEGTEWLYGYIVQGQVCKDLGYFNFSGQMTIYADGSIQFEEGIAEYVDKDLLGTYIRADGTDVEFTIDSRQGVYHSVSPMASASDWGRGILALHTDPAYCDTYAIWTGEEYGMYSVYIDWNSEYLYINDVPYVKVSDELGSVPMDEAGIIGEWEGTYMNSNRSKTAYGHVIILPVGNDGQLASCFDFGPLQGRDDYKSGRILGAVEYDQETHAVSITGKNWLEKPSNYSFADFAGTMNDSVTYMSGTEPYVFELSKISE